MEFDFVVVDFLFIEYIPFLNFLFFFSCLLTAMRIVNLTLAAVTYVDVLAQHCTSSIVFSLVLVPNHKFQAIFVVVAANHL